MNIVWVDKTYFLGLLTGNCSGHFVLFPHWTFPLWKRLESNKYSCMLGQLIIYFIEHEVTYRLQTVGGNSQTHSLLWVHIIRIYLIVLFDFCKFAEPLNNSFYSYFSVQFYFNSMKLGTQCAPISCQNELWNLGRIHIIIPANR